MKKLYKGDPNRVIPWDGKKESYLWDLFPPSFNCPYHSRVGRFSDGGKVICNPEMLGRLGPDATVVSVGVRGDISFETELASYTRARVHAFDPTVDSLPNGKSKLEPCGGAAGSITFHKVGLQGNGAMKKGMEKLTFKPLRELMAIANTNCIDLLKVDCEGCEFGAFAEMRKDGTLKHVDQLSIEIHFPQKHTNDAGPASGVQLVFDLFEACEEAGLLPFSWEVNHNAAGYLKVMPFVVEYTFVRPGSNYINVPPYDYIPPTCHKV